MTVLEYYTNEPITSRHKLSHSRICLMKLLINAEIASFQQIKRKVFYFYTSYAANTIIRFSSTSRIQSTLFHYPYYTHIKKNFIKLGTFFPLAANKLGIFFHSLRNNVLSMTQWQYEARVQVLRRDWWKLVRKNIEEKCSKKTGNLDSTICVIGIRMLTMLFPAYHTRRILKMQQQ